MEKCQGLPAGLARGAGSGYLEGEGDMKRKYWSNVFAMLGVALLATSFFAKEDWLLGAFIGGYFLYLGAKLYEG